MRVVLKILVFGFYLGDHFSFFKGLAKVLRKKTRKDYTFSRKMCDSSVVPKSKMIRQRNFGFRE